MKLQPWKRFLAQTEGKGMSFYLCQLIVATICFFFFKNVWIYNVKDFKQ